MRGYELTLIFPTELDDATRDATLKKITDQLPLVEGSPDPVIHNWGRLQMAYPINKQTEGYYVFIEANFIAGGINDLERNILFMEDVIRHMVILKEK